MSESERERERETERDKDRERHTENECPFGTFSMQPGRSTFDSCLGCSSNTVSAATRTLCLCAVGFQFNPVTWSCIECIAALRQFKTNVGNEACRICTDERIYSAVMKTCSDPALTTQVVRLFHSINYVAFYVFNSNENGTRITDIL